MELFVESGIAAMAADLTCECRVQGVRIAACVERFEQLM